MSDNTAVNYPPRGGISRPRLESIPLLSYGFRPFFLGAALWACAAMVLWIGMVSGSWSFAGSYGAIAWHAHEFLFGYIAAVVTGFLLTAIPNWTGRLPLRGSPLLALFLLWVAGRIAMLATGQIGSTAAAVVDCIYLPIVAAIAAREIVAGRNWRNLMVVVPVSLFALADIVFQIEVIAHGAPDYGVRLGCAAIVALITVIGGRITPSFTNNWLSRQNSDKRPAPLGRFDVAAIAVGVVALLSWVAAPNWTGSGVLLLVMAAALAARLARWAGERTWREPILLILHLGYAFVPLGALAVGVSILWPGVMPPSGALHAWTTGAMGTMTLAVMTRATLGHTGRDIATSPATFAIYAAILAAALARVIAPLSPALYEDALFVAAVAWFVAFGTFVAVYGPMLVGAIRGSS